jgi:very-short-patch-repair endonuclease
VRGRMKRNNVDKCRILRKNQTDSERKLWSILRNRRLSGAKFRRQFPIGKYILDFYSPKYKLGIEADGGQHYKVKGKIKDQQRSKELSKLGVRIIRFSDRDILTNLDGVYRMIHQNIEKLRKSSLPLVERVRVRGKKTYPETPSP